MELAMNINIFYSKIPLDFIDFAIKYSHFNIVLPLKSYF